MHITENDPAVRESRRPAYGLLSTCRGELMGVAMLWVMLFHAYSLPVPWLPLDLVKRMGFAGVDIFLLLSAMGLYVSRRNRPEEGFLSYLTRRLKRVLPAYWLVVGVYSLWLVVRGSIRWSTALWSMSTLHYWFEIPDTFNWYVPALLVFYALAPFYIRLFDRCPRKEWLTAAVSLLSYGVYRLSSPLGFFHTVDFIYRIPAFAMGVLAGYYLLEKRPLTWRHCVAWGIPAVVGLVLGVLTLKWVIYVPYCYLIALLLMPVCLAGAWLLQFLRRGWLGKILRLIGACSLEIYLLNVIVTREMDVLTLAGADCGLSKIYAVFGTLLLANLLLGVLLHKGLERAEQTVSRRRAVCR